MFSRHKHVVLALSLFAVSSSVSADCESFGDLLGNTAKALLIGNANYTKRGVPVLRGATKDAEAMQKGLSAAGYAGVRCEDISAARIEDQVNLFLDANNGLLRPTDTFVFYFSGHGGWLRTQNVNLLYGVAATSLQGPHDAYSLQKLLDLALSREQAMHVVIVDACRLQATQKGTAGNATTSLKTVNPPRGVYIAYAAAEGAPAFTDGDRISPFTSALSRELEVEAKGGDGDDRDIDLLFRRVRARVLADGWPAEPWTSHNMTGSFTFRRQEVKSITDDLPRRKGRPGPAVPDESDNWCDGIDAAVERVWDSSARKLRPPFLATDVLRLQLCGSGDWSQPLEQVHQGLASGDLLTLPLPENSAKKLLGNRWPRLTLAYDTSCSELSLPDCRRIMEVILSKDDAKSFKAIAGGGKLALLPMHWGKKGHYEITRTALGRVNAALPAPAVRIVSDASQDPDFWEWGTPAAHAQTKQNKHLRPEAVEKSQTAFVQWQTEAISRVAASCDTPRIALYHLGYALHGIQDLVFHGGITNAEHSHRDYVGPAAVDTEEDYDKKFETATEASAELVRRVLARAPCAAALTSYNEEGWLSAAEKQALFKERKRDLTVRALLEFRKYAARVKNAIAAGEPETAFYLKPRWIDPANLQTIRAYLDKIVPPVPVEAAPAPPPQETPTVAGSSGS